MNTQLQAIINADLPAFHGNIRRLTRKEYAQHVRALLKEMGLKGVSVTTPNYSMAQAIDIRLPRVDADEHEPIHAEAEKIANMQTEYHGIAQFCSICQERIEAQRKIQAIILAAYPDLDNRSDSNSDYYDYCLSIE